MQSVDGLNGAIAVTEDKRRLNDGRVQFTYEDFTSAGCNARKENLSEYSKFLRSSLRR